MKTSPARIAELRNMVAQPKVWVAGEVIAWSDAPGKPGKFEYRAALEVDGTQPESLLFRAFFAPTRIPGAPDKLSLTLLFSGARILGLDEGDLSGHRNDFGAGRPYFGQKIGCPHLHTISDDSLDGYAEPLAPASHGRLWTQFMLHAKIEGAPGYAAPIYQLDLLP